MRNEGGEFQRVDNTIAVEVGPEIGTIKVDDLVRDVHRVDIVIVDGVGVASKKNRGSKIKSEAGALTAKILVGKIAAKVGKAFD